MRGVLNGDFYDFGTTPLIMEVMTMWIKTSAGSLINTDRIQSIYHYDLDNSTFADFGSRRTKISEGDSIPQIQEALTKNRTFMEVH